MDIEVGWPGADIIEDFVEDGGGYTGISSPEGRGSDYTDLVL
jgi:hypothetical protein